MRQLVTYTIRAIGLALATFPMMDAGAQSQLGHATGGSQEIAFKKAIRQLYDIKESAWTKGDVETIVTRFYAPDAVSAGEGDPTTLKGTKQFREAYKQLLQDITSVRVQSVRSVVNGNAGWDWANFYANVKPGKAREYPPSPVRILFLFSKEKGRWICEGDIFVTGKFDDPL
jgi:uncharacterized protein (TIGR02246 family)